MTTLHQTEVDGVRCFWVASGRPTLAALLVFRFGIVDEPLVESGFQHLLEHLALHGRGGGPLQVNGQVGLLDTVLEAHGPAERVAEHFNDVTSWLNAPRYDELERERNVLRAEAAVRGTGPTVAALTWRYGARGPGVLSYGEPGLGRATSDLLDARAAKAFNRLNAALVLDGPPPPTLRLTLPDGALTKAPRAVPVEHSPGMYVDESGLVMSGVVQRGPAGLVASQLLQKLLVERFRHQDGTAYAPWATSERVDHDRTVLLAGTDLRADALSTLADSVMDLRHNLHATPDLDLLNETRAGIVQQMRDPYAQMGLAHHAAAMYLRGEDVKQLEELVDEVEAVTASQVVETFIAFRDSLLLGVPGATAWNGQMRRLEAPVTAPQVRGPEFRSVNWPADKAKLVVSEDAVEVKAGKQARSLQIEHVDAVLAAENGLRTIVPPDGYVVTVNPHQWHGGHRAVELIDRATQTDKLLSVPAVEGIDQGVRTTAWRRWTGLLRGHAEGLFRFVLVVIGVAIMVGGFALAVAAEKALFAVLGVVMGIGWLRGVVSND